MTELRSGQKDQTQVLSVRQSGIESGSVLRAKKLSMQQLWLHLSKTMGPKERAIFLAKAQIPVGLQELYQEMEGQGA